MGAVMDALQPLFAARAEAEARTWQVANDLGETQRALNRAGTEAFMRALAARGIAEGRNIVIEGHLSGPWSGKARDIRHGADPVFFRHATVDSAPASRPHENSTDRWWWFRITIARLKKDGNPRYEYRNFVVNGDTPEDAASKIAAVKPHVL